MTCFAAGKRAKKVGALTQLSLLEAGLPTPGLCSHPWVSAKTKDGRLTPGSNLCVSSPWVFLSAQLSSGGLTG